MRYRYRTDEELKDSGVEWIGKIPKDWEIKKIKHIFEEISEKNYSEDVELLSLYTHIGVKPQKELEAKGNKAQTVIEYKIVEKNDIVVNKMLAWMGAIGISEYNGVISPAYNIYRKYNKCINSKFYHYLFRTKKFSNECYKNGWGIMLMRWTTTPERFKDIYVPYIPFVDEKIANFLDKKTSQFDSIISKKEKLIEKLEEAKKSLISEVVTGKVKVVKSDEGYELVKRKSDEMKDSGVEWLGDIPKDWEVKKFKYIFSLNKGLSITKVDLKEEGIPCVNYGEIHSRYRFELKPSIHKLKYVDELYLKYNTTSLLSYGDFIFCDTSEDIDGCGNFTCLNENSSIFAGYHTIIAKALKQINFRYMSYLFDSNSWRIQIRTRVSGVKVFSITQTILKETNIIMPYLLEQENIVKYLDVKCNEINSSICKIKLQIEKLKEAKQSLISEAVTGKIEILD